MALIKLSPSDTPANVVEVSLAVAQMSVTINNMLEDFGGATDTAIPLHNVSSEALKRVVAFCEDHVARPRPALATNTPEGKGKYVLDDWDKTFLAKLNQEQLFELILAANYLDIKTLLDATCKTVADMIIGKSPEQIRSLFQIKNDFSPAEEEAVRRENSWCEDA